MSNATITPEERHYYVREKQFQITSEDVRSWLMEATRDRRKTTYELNFRIHRLGTALKAVEERAAELEAENARLRYKCGESAPEGTEIYHVGPTEYVLCPSCNYEIEDPWDEPETDQDADGWHGVITCRNCSSKIEVHSQLTHFWTARLAGEDAARRAAAESEVRE